MIKSRIEREKQTIKAMILLSCNTHHHTTTNRLCEECKKLLSYALQRLDQCPFADKKTVCANCRIHCYKPEMRERIKNVMKNSGPKMIIRHPILTLYHFFDKYQKS